MRKYLPFTVIAGLAAMLGWLGPDGAAAQTRTTLDIYVIDVEGGNATLLVAPSGESLLIDTGNVAPDAAVRDAERILAATQDARLTQIDHLIVTHWHGDHFGGLAELAAHIPIVEYIDHGPNVQPGELPDAFLRNTYPQLYAKSKHTTAKPGDRISLAGADVRVVTSAGAIIKTPLPGGGKANPACAAFKTAESNLEDPQSVSVYVTYGKFRTYHSGDLPKGKEFELMCPTTKIGPVDVLLGLHHGVATSNSPVLIHALHPRVAIMNNGTRKGGDPDVMESVHTSPGLEDLWQMHFSTLSGQENTVPGMFIANTADDQPSSMPIAAVPAPAPGPGAPPPPVHNGKAYWIKVSAQLNGSFTVTNTRNGFTKTY
jgi:competence protein ComEC